MFVIRDGPVHRHSQSVRRGKLPRPMFMCCGSVGLILTISGGVVLGMGQQRYKQQLRNHKSVPLRHSALTQTQLVNM